MKSTRPNLLVLSLIALVALLCLAGGCGGGTKRSTAATPSTSAAAASPLARGKQLYEVDGCSGCHSIDGERLAGPSWKGLAGSRVKLTDGRTVTADDAYLSRHITEPDAFTVQGYPGDVMAQAIETLDLKSKPADVRALVSFIDSLR